LSLEKSIVNSNPTRGLLPAAGKPKKDPRRKNRSIKSLRLKKVTRRKNQIRRGPKRKRRVLPRVRRTQRRIRVARGKIKLANKSQLSHQLALADQMMLLLLLNLLNQYLHPRKPNYHPHPRPKPRSKVSLAQKS
jgi:hypothetical protein